MNFAEWTKERKRNSNGGADTASETGRIKASSFGEWTTLKKPTKSVQDWIEASNALQEEIQKHYETWQEDDGYYRDRVNNLIMMAPQWRKQYAGNDDAIADIDAVVSALGKLSGYVRQYEDYYGKFDSREDYEYALERSKQFYDAWGHYADAEDFEKYAAQGAAIENPTMNDAESGGQFLWWTWDGAEIGNIVTYSREHADELAVAGANNTTVQGNYKYRSMTDEEVDIYNYLLAKEGKDKADEFLSFLDEDLNAREGGALAERLQGIDIPVLEEIAIGTYGLGAGVDQWAGGVKQAFTNEKLPTSITQFANAEILDSLDGFGKYAYGATNVIGNMAPSIGVSSLTKNQTLGALATGVSAAGNAYGSALRDGRSVWQARAYSTLVGASEAALQRLLGGIGSLGGFTDDVIKMKLDMINNSLLRVSAKLGADVISEVAEEEIQNFLEPAFQSIIFGEEYDAPQMDELLETAILTAITTPILGGAGTVSRDLAEHRLLTGQGQKIMGADGGVEALRQLAYDMAGGTSQGSRNALARQSEKVGKKVTPRGVGQLYNTVITASDQTNQADIVKSLTRKGIGTQKAERIAQALVAAYNGQELTKAQSKLLESVKDNEDVQNAVSRILRNPQSTMGQRSQNISSFQEGVANNSLVKAAQSATNGAQTVRSDSVDTGVGEGLEGSAGASVGDGAVEFVKGKNGKLAVRTAEGGTVEVSQAKFASEDEAIVYETVAKLATNASAANLMLSTYEGSGVPAQVFAKGIEEAYVYGSVGIPLEQAMKRGSFIGELTEHQAKTGYKLGKLFSGKQTGKEQAAVRRSKDAKAADTSKGEVHFEGDRSKLNKTQKASLDAMEVLAKSLGVQIYVFESEVGPDGKHQGANGWYDPGDGSIHIDLYAGADGKGVMLFTVAHELTHFIRQWSPAKFKVLANFLMKQYGQKGVSVQELVENQMAKAKRNGRELTFEEAFEEVVADSMEAMLTDGNVIQWMADLKQQDKGLWQKIRDWFKDLAGKLKAVVDSYKGVQPDSTEGKLVADMQDVICILESLYQDALVDASENYNAAGAQKNTTADSGAGNDIAIKRSERIVDQIRKSLDKIMALDTVYEIDANNATPFTSDRKTDEKSGHEVFKGQGGVANRPGFGRVVLSKRGAVHTVHHGNGPAKQASFPAIKAVIEKGVEIYRDIDHEGRGYDTVTFSAPIDFFGNPSPLATVVKVFEGANADKTFYIHEICDAEGNYIQFPEEGAEQKNSSTNFVEPTSTVSAADNGIAPENSIHNLDEIVNSDSSAVRNQMRGETLTDWDVLEQAAQMLEEQKRYRAKNPDGKTDLTSLEKERAELQERLAKQKELGEDTAQIRKQIKDVDGRIRAAQNNLQLTDGQRYALDVFNQRLERIKELRTQKTEVKQLLDEQKANGDSPSELAQSKRRIDNLNRMIREQTNELLEISNKAVLKQVLGKARTVVENKLKQEHEAQLEAVQQDYRKQADAKIADIKQKYRQAAKEKVAKVRETAEKRDAKGKLQKLVLDTARWLAHPAKTDVKCPDLLKLPYAEFLNSIDMSSERLAKGGDPTKNDLRLASAMDSLATALERIVSAQDPTQETTAVLDTGYLDLPVNFVQKLRDMTEQVKGMMVEGEYVVNTMSAEEVRKLSQMIRTLNHAIKEVSTLYANLRFANVEALGVSTMSFMDGLGEIQKTGGMKDFVQWENALPYYAFMRFGEGGQSVFEGLMDAQDKLAFLAQEIFDFQEKTWSGKEAKSWSEDSHTIDLPDGDKLTLTTADAMSIYCLSRRRQGIKHLVGGGVRVVGIRKGSQKAADSRSRLTMKDIDAIVSSLTERQKKVAEAIQEFMSTTCSEWGNEISMKRFLTKEFTERFYFPIESNDENLPTKDPGAQQSDLFRLLNISATKPIDPRANNEVIIRNVFDVFTGHASDMARLNAYGMALLDYMKWLNYRVKTVNDLGQIDVRGVRKSMEKAYGNAAGSYVLNLIKDVNGRPSDHGDPSLYMKWMRAAKTASVGNNLRVATLQVTSYPRAALVLSPKSLALGLSKKPNIEKAKKYCGIALWKSFGFYDTNISRSIEDQMKGVKTVKQKLIELSLKGAEIGDALTWGALWNACEYEVAATKQFEVGSEEFNQAVGKKLREVVYRTQVVDSTLTRSQIMRSKRGMAQEAAAFMSEPTLSANILMDAGFRFHAQKRRTGSAKEAWSQTGKYVGKAVAVYSIGQLTAALLESLWDAWRDDEDEKFGEKFSGAFVENLALNLVPFNKIPIVSDVFEAALASFDLGYFSSDKLSTTWLTQAVSAADAWSDVLSGESSATVYNALYKTVRAASSYVGVSFSGAMREAVALWNNTAGAADPTLKVLTYERSDAKMGKLLLDALIEGDDRQVDSVCRAFENEKDRYSALRTAIKDRFEGGEIDEDTAMEYLVDYGGMDEDEAFWRMEEWAYEKESDEEFKKYNEFYGAVQSGKNLKKVIAKYTDNGVEKKTLASQITAHFKPLYREMSKSERAAIKGYLLNAYELLGYDRARKSKDIDRWLEN